MITLFLYFAALIAYGASQTACPTNFQCKTCANATYGCTECYSGQGLSMELYPSPNYICAPCGTSCTNCLNRTTCTECSPGYGPLGGTNCSACLAANCLACPVAIQTCAQCKPGYAFYQNSNLCGACSSNCAAGCQLNGAGKCDKCDSGFGLTSTNSCAPCSSNCAAGCSLTGAGKCDKCNLGYGPASSDGSCGPCSSYCVAGCNATGAGKCDKCDAEYGLTSNGSCGLCFSNCGAGCNQTGAGKCDWCDPGYGLTSNGSCGPCSANCNIAVGCRMSGTCDQCKAGYELNSNKTCAAITTTTRATTTAIAKTSTAATTTSTSSITTTTTTASTTIITTTITTAIRVSEITIEPTYGPMAGGTAITIVTTWTRPNISIAAVYIGSNLTAGNLSQSTSASNFNIPYQITALVRSPPITDESLIDQPLPIILGIYPDLVNVSTGMYFTYKRNPTIYDINPRVIPLSGGIHLTVSGSNLASASNRIIRAVVVIWRNNSLSSINEASGPCYQPNENGTQMICLSPPIYIPEDFLLYLFGQTDQYSDVYRRRKRRDVLTIDWLKGHATPLTLRSRFKRSPNNILTNHTYYLPSTEDNMQVSMDAVFDGFQVPLDSVSKFRVLNPPNISCADNIYFDPKDSGTITITGNGMEQCCGESDYSVRIGNGLCNVTDLTDNVLTCEPPKDKPQQTESDKLYCGENFAVFIDVGNRTYRCSCLTYVDNSKTTLITIIAATVGSVLLIFVAIVVISIVVKRFRTSDKPPTQQAYIRNPMAEKRSDMMLTASRQPNYNRSLNAHGTGSTTLSPERDYNRLSRPDYSGMPTNQPYGYRYNNPSFLGYAKTFEESVSDQPLRQIYLPYSRNI